MQLIASISNYATKLSQPGVSDISDILSHILALFGKYCIAWYQGNIAIFIRYLNLSRCRIFSVLDDTLLSDIWVICQRCQFGRAEKDIYFNSNTSPSFNRINIHALSQNELCGDHPFFVTSGMSNSRAFLGSWKISHLVIFAKYRLHIAWTLQKYQQLQNWP